MNAVFSTLATAVGAVAPTLATMLGGPFAGAAVTALAGAFGLAPNASPEAITKVIQNGAMTPDIIAKIREADQKHAEIMGQQNIDLAKLNAAHDEAFAKDDTEDRASARAMQTAQPSIVPAVLSTIVVTGFFGAVGSMMAGIDATDNQAFLILIGALAAALSQVLNYWFGSTRGSSDKNLLLAQSMPATKP